MIHPFGRQTGSTTAQMIEVFGGQARTVSGGQRDHVAFLPRSLTLYDGTYAARTAPGASLIYRLEFGAGATTDFVQTGNDVDITDPAINVRTDTAGTWAAASTTPFAVPFAEGVCAKTSITGSANLQSAYASIVYQDDSDESISYHGWGSILTNLISGAGTNSRFINFGMGANVDTVESDIQFPWPLDGTFQHVGLGYAISTGGNDVTLTLNLDGSASGITFTLSDTSGTYVLEQDSALTASVTAGQLVSWEMVAASGATPGGFQCVAVCGFIAD